MIWLVGCRGMLGKEFAAAFDKAGIAYTGTGSETDVTDKKAVISFVSGKNFTYIINCSAYTAVDKAESEENRAMLINCDGVFNLAMAAKQTDAVLIHFSTDYVFDGEASEPYKETDATNPVSAYGRTKLAGEKALIDIADRYFIFRISWLYGRFGGNFVSTMIRLMNERDSLGVVDDQKGSPTYTKCLAENIIRLMNSGSNKYGIYHCSDEGVISWYDFAAAIYRMGKEKGIIRKNVELRRITTDQYPTPAKRPAMSAFNKDKIKGLDGFKLNRWEDNLSDYFENYGEK
ncbi:dTDP-4-dehydrorhamnose reductase [Seleniivibrio woodruffii]|uniref:dTDP-4-dehydrorhamnose reductase n=1 Tax=Seleniivibrio woodruffii TaxID=1078050 RepID=UPI0026EF7C7B|nr:dTDP-4-dehydrorhamnose reductase [Seleniivibrio woodruffii]